MQEDQPDTHRIVVSDIEVLKVVAAGDDVTISDSLPGSDDRIIFPRAAIPYLVEALGRVFTASPS